MIRQTYGYTKCKTEIWIEGEEVGEFRDAGPWRSYEMDSHGATLEELKKNAHIFETDQDGGSLNDNHYSEYDFTDEVERVLEKIFNKLKDELKPEETNNE